MMMPPPSQQFYQQPPYGAMMAAQAPRMPYPTMVPQRPPGMMAPPPQYPMAAFPGYAMAPPAAYAMRPPGMPDMSAAAAGPPTRTGTPEEVEAFQARLKQVPPALQLTPEARSQMNLQTTPVDHVAMARFVFGILRSEVAKDGCGLLTGGADRSAISQSQTGGERLTAMDSLSIAGLRRRAKDDTKTFQKTCDAMGDGLIQKPSKSLAWFTLSPFSSKRQFYKIDKQYQVDGQSLQSLLAVGAHDDGENEAATDPFVRDDANAYISRILQKVTSEAGESLEVLPPRAREVQADAADLISILGMCFKEHAAMMTRRVVEGKKLLEDPG